ncbi:hypothetical protein BGZ76_008903, partial [Entomortierella beljakovae]
MNDLWRLRSKDHSKEISTVFEETWEKELEKRSPSLVKALAIAFGGPFYLAGFWKLITDTLALLQPLLLRQMLLFVMSYRTEKPQPLYRGYGIASLMLLCSLSQTAFVHQYFHHCLRTGMRVRAALITALYRKALRLSNTSRQEFTVGEIVNHMSIDTQRIENVVNYLHALWSSIFQMAITLYLLYTTLGWSVFVGIGVMSLMVPLNGKLSLASQKYQKQQMAFKDQRIKVMNEILNGIRVIKLYAWEGTFLQKVLSIRNDSELRMLRNIGFVMTGQMFTWNVTPFLVSLAIFSFYVGVMGKTLTTDVLFTAISLLNLLQSPLVMLPWVVSSLIEARVAIIRVNKFLLSAEIDPSSIVVEAPQNHTTASQYASDKYTLLVTDASYSWYKNSPPAISDINLALKKDCILSIIGRVGSGKSSLIAALCGDLERVSGEIRIRGSVAFVPQQAWIMNDTLRANIVFGNTYDPAYYQKTIEACCLQQDFDMLLGGDMTEIGERGINLSGGQKARISLARAVYSRADVYLFDDPLSAVDAHVGRSIFDNVIGPRGLLAGKTRVFVTHQIQYLAQSTSILMLRDGKMVEQGEFQELMRNKGETYQLMTEYGKAPTKRQESSESETISGATNMDGIADTGPSTRRGSVVSNKSHSSITQTRQSNETILEDSAGGENDLKSKVDTKHNIIVEEEMEQGSVGRSVYLAYLKACSYKGVIFFVVSLISSEALRIMMSLWLTYWSRSYDRSRDDRSSEHGTLYYIGIYALLGLIFSILSLFQSTLLYVYCGVRSARILHEKMLRSILRSPMSFFDTTPMGRILNRFSKDQATIDEILPRTFSGYTYNLIGVISILSVVVISTPTLIVVIIPSSFFYLWLQRYFLATSRELRRLDSVSRSPVFAHFQETLGGVSTIRAYRQQGRFTDGNESRLDQNLRAFYPGIAGNRWLAIRLECVSSILIFGTASLSVFSLSRDKSIDPGLVGLSLTYALGITQTLNWMVRQYAEVESNIVAVERLQEYVELKPEAPEIYDDR